jgi:RNA 3'-terminal phosphate cyclase (ATP)
MAAGILTIDGSQGEGGGQVLRSSLSLSLVTGRPIVIEKIRAGRKKPGLMRQHLIAVLAAAGVGGAEVEGAALGSRRLVFRPDAVRAGNFWPVGRPGRGRGQRSLVPG